MMTRNNSEPMAKIVNDALDEITMGQFVELQQKGLDALLHYFHRAWNERMDVYFQAEEMNLATVFLGTQAKEILRVTGCNSRKEIIEKFERFILRHHKKDTRVILDLSFNAHKIDTEWLPLDEYLEKTKKSDPITEQD